MRKYRNYSDQDIINLVPKVTSCRQLLIALNLKPMGGNFANMKRKLQKLGITAPHWTGRAWNRGQQLKNWQHYKLAKSFKKHLIKLQGHKCQICGRRIWNGLPIMLEIDHIDGNKTNNTIINLRLLCPNCHAQTPTWRNRKKAST